LNAGLKYCAGEVLFLTDVRQTLDPDAVSHLAANFADPSVGAATGELRCPCHEAIGEQADMEVYWRYELWVRRRHSLIDSTFAATGCLYAVRRSLVDPIPADTLTDDLVIPLRAFFKGYRVIFDPEALASDYPVVEGAEFRRRLRTLAGLWQVSIRMPALFGRANRMRLHFLSHKSSRLALPWALLLIVLGTLGLDASVSRDCLLAGLAMFAVLALADGLAPGRSQWKRVTSPARTFLLMNAAAFLSIVVFFIPPATLWRTTRVTIPK
jgi:cellulose synthase/poly-beta-1,6-N-acetylglucosamine synthase-like glycosyltransferase